MTDRITVTGIRAHGYHGVLEHEKQNSQDFIVDAVLWLDLAPADHSDDLVQTVDYGELVTRIAEIVSQQRFDLIEKLAATIADDVLRDERLHAVEVTVHKPSAPVAVKVDDIAVTVRRSRRAGRATSIRAVSPAGELL